MKFSMLQQEHMALGAALEELEDLSVVAQYHDLETEYEALSNGTALIDISWARLLLIQGQPLENFAQAALTCAPLKVGQASPTALLAGDGALINVDLAARTGDQELLLVDTSARFDVLDGWLDFLEHIESDGVSPYAHISHSEQSEALVCLQLTGARAQELLTDYVADKNLLPKPGRVTQVNLDKIACILIGLPTASSSERAHRASYLVLVPAAYAAILWRSFLSFTYVEPVGHRAWDAAERVLVPWYEHIQKTKPLMVPASVLESWGLVRQQQNFIGARGLYGTN